MASRDERGARLFSDRLAPLGGLAGDVQVEPLPDGLVQQVGGAAGAQADRAHLAVEVTEHAERLADVLAHRGDDVA
jgi:hypothetical protein